MLPKFSHSKSGPGSVWGWFGLTLEPEHLELLMSVVEKISEEAAR